ncbi:MAG TPA: tyrosine-type recombinase/integrase [Sphingobium sp.]
MNKRRWLPDGVSEYADRHGKKRYRFRKTGFLTHHFKSLPGSVEFMTEYAEATQARVEAGKGGREAARGTINDLCARYYETPTWRSMAPTSQKTYRGIIERFREKHGAKPVAAVTTGHLDAILGKMQDTPAAANNLRKVLKRLFRLAVKLGLRRDNPAVETDSFKTGTGFHTWTEEEIEQYRERHPLGTKARLAMELLLNTAARRCNVASLQRSQLRKGKFHIQHVKGNDETAVPIFRETQAAIEAMPVAGLDYFIVTEFGKPFTAPGFGNWFRERCNEAGLHHCSAHGLRKAMSRRLAEAGSSDAQGRSFTGQKKNATFAHYAAKANRERLAEDALANLENKNLANLGKTE